MSDQNESRLVELESRLAHHERLTEELSSVMAGQGQAIDKLAHQVRRLSERIEDIESALRSIQGDRPPPHY
jgi:SlyX protein